MSTDTGVEPTGSGDWFDRLTGVWLEQQRIKKGIDFERTDEDQNIPDRVDVETGNWSKSGLAGGSTQVSLGGLTPLQIGLSLAAAFVVAKLITLKKG